MMDCSINFKKKQKHFSKQTIEEINSFQNKLGYIPPTVFLNTLNKIFELFKNDNQVKDPKDTYNQYLQHLIYYICYLETKFKNKTNQHTKLLRIILKDTILLAKNTSV
jgi:hypothetical protein